MNSRMNRYYKNNTNLRSRRNKELYNDIYSSSKYTNIEGIASIDNENEIDIEKIKEMLEKKDNYHNGRERRKLSGEITEERPYIKRSVTPSMEQRDYDIRDILNKAKENKVSDDKKRVLKETQYDILKELNLKSNEKESVSEEEEIKEMINTITNTSLLNKMNDAQLATDLLQELTGDDTKVGELNNVKELIEEDKKNRTNMYNTDDNTFFTSSLKLSKKDFETNDSEESSGIFIKIIIVTLIIAIIVATVILFTNGS